MAKNKVHKWNMRRHGNINWIRTRKLDDGTTYEDGCVITPFGIVSLYSQGDEKYFPNTDLRFVHNGTHYSRSIQKRYSKRYLVTLAHRFAKDIVGE